MTETKAGIAEPVPATGKAVRAKPGAPTAPAAPPSVPKRSFAQEFEDLARQGRTLEEATEQARTLSASEPPAGLDLRAQWTRAKRASAEAATREALGELTVFTNPMRYATDLYLFGKARESIEPALRRTEQVRASLRRYWESQSGAQLVDFWDKAGSGLGELAAFYRQREENVFRAVSRYRGMPYWENYFLRLWKEPGKAATYFGARKLKRVFQDIQAGIQAGLEPLSWNPEDLMEAAEYGARRYVLMQKLLREYQALGLIALVPVGGNPPANFRCLDRNWARFYGEAAGKAVPVAEYWAEENLARLLDAEAQIDG